MVSQQLLYCAFLKGVYNYGAFPTEGAGRFRPQKCGTGRVSTAVWSLVSFSGTPRHYARWSRGCWPDNLPQVLSPVLSLFTMEDGEVVMNILFFVSGF